VEVSPQHINTFLSKCASSNWSGVFFSSLFQTQFQFWLQDLNEPIIAGSEQFIFSPFDPTNSPLLILNPGKKNVDAVQYIGETQNIYHFWKNAQVLKIQSTTVEQYGKQFDQYTSAIRSGNCSKAILSTVIKENLPTGLNIGEYVFKLRKEYPQAFVYIFSSPFAGTWIGATPETLLKWNDNEVSTMSLAGTKKTNDASFNFGEKEKQEQKIVTDYIIEIFKRRFSKVELKEREELSYGEMTHLLSRVKAVVDNSYTSAEFLELASQLHPTPAVGGFPVNQALDLIQSTETHPRLYYSGFLGVVGRSSAELAVNLRCMTLANGSYYVFAGGGITAESDLQAEWGETRLKANALLKFVE
jgi:isochorismate synthase